MPDPGSILQRIDRLIAQLAELRAEIAASEPSEGNGPDGDPPEEWLDATSVAAQLGVPIDTVRYAARHKSIGRKRAGTWEINLPLARQWFRRG